MEIKEYDLIVVGGGAAGLMAAGTAAFNGKRVILLEKMEKTGRKVRITGKGRCNLTNTSETEEFLSQIQNGSEFFVPAFQLFSNTALMRFFDRRKVKLDSERGGRVYPKSGKAWDIAQALVDWCREEGVDIECGARVKEIMSLMGKARGVKYFNKRGFERKIEAPNIILCTGGASYAATGSTGDGYILAHALGHTIEPLRPSLVPLVSSHPEMRFMEGLELRNVKAQLLIDAEVVQEEFGEVSITSRGVEGAIVLRVSRKAVDAIIDNRKVEIVIDLKSAMDAEELKARIKREMEEQPETLMVAELLRKIMPRELVVPMSKEIDVHAKNNMSDIDDEKIDALVVALKNFRLKIIDYRPFEEAIITAGGVSLEEIDSETMESKLIKGLYFAGELMDIDANTGGYNLQIAFSTGRLAAQMRKKD